MAVTPQAPPGGADAEALFKEARRLRRRRWLTAAGILLAAATAAAAAGYLVLGDNGNPPVRRIKPAATAQVPRGPSPAVDAKALRGHGNLAFVSRGRLWVLDGSTQALRQVRHGRAAADPQFSPDGRWLAFAARSRIWVAKSDGAAPRPVPGSRTGLSLSWSPRGDLLTGAGAGIIEVTSRGAVHLVTRQGSYGAWSPDGNRVAFITTRHKVTLLEEIPGRGGRPVVWYRSPFHPAIPAQHVPAVPNLVTLAAVLPHNQGLLYWFDPDSADAADGQALYLIKAPGQHPIRVGGTLTGPGYVAVSRTGEFAIVNGLNRYAWQTKTLELCSPVSGSCTPVRAPRGELTLDPAWSPDGHVLAFVEAPASPAAGFPQPAVARWYATHTLWILRTPGTAAHQMPGTNGATAPAWSASGTSLVYEAGDALWLVPALASRPVKIATPLFPVNNWPTYYGEIGWAQQFAWSAAR
jgi:dipeptidyl aminopeptidase/acylaminoacyl peptidase